VKASIPLVHGAIAGWTGQISTIFPNDNTMQKIYRDKELKGSEEYLGIPAFAPALISSIQVSEAIKILINKAELLRNKILFINLLEHEYQLIEL
jgi:molybdopterin/thiamine biosynthesis adenylyltransferase